MKTRTERRACCPPAVIEWMRAGGGVWHGGGLGEPGRTRGFQLWIALPPELELGPSESIYLSPEVIPHDGPARVLIGSYGTATSAIKTPSPMNYLAVRLKAGERWTYQPPAGHTVLWTAVGGAPFSFRTNCSSANWWPSGRRTPRSNSRPNPMQSSYLARLSRMIMTSYWAPIPCIQAPRHCVKPRLGSRRSRHA